MWNKTELEDFVKTLRHPAWGWSHCQRILELSLRLAKEQNFKVDVESITAASFLHDIGSFPQYKVESMDHTDRSIQLIDKILPKYNFPVDKIPVVKEIIAGHMFYHEPSTRIEAIVFHDADVLDFMGCIGITRLLAIVGISDWTPDVKSAIKLIEKFSNELPEKLHTPLAQKMGEKRKNEMVSFLHSLIEESNELTLI